MGSIIFKVEKTEKGIDVHIDGDYDLSVNMLANAFIIRPELAAMIGDSIAVSLKELSRRDLERTKSKIIT